MTDGAVVREGSFSLDDRYAETGSEVYLSGIQALVRMLLDRARVDRRAGARTAVYVSGYEGSPLAGYDLELARRSSLLADHSVVHQPGLNEELAATAVSGTQLAGRVADPLFDGVTGIWYGKAPGLDRATDALRHANMIGTDGRGGAVALVGDDPAAKSSSIPCSSEYALADLMMPTFFPADPGEVLLHGLHAVELSRASGLWSAIKVTTPVADGSATTTTWSGWRPPALPGLPAYRHEPSSRLLGTKLAELEENLHLVRLPLALDYVRASGLNRIVGAADARIGFVSAGTGYLALRQALAGLGIGDDDLDRLGIRLLKLGVVYPLEPSIVTEFAAGLDQLVVVEDKRGFLEDALKAVLYGPNAPVVHGKRYGDGSVLFSALGELDVDSIRTGVGRCLSGVGVSTAAPDKPRPRALLQLAARSPFFCSGCPHNSSTKVAPGTLVGAGIGCHAMLLLMPGDQTGDITGLCQMGGEGGHWIGMSQFVSQRHFVQNLGDGTLAHSGSLAIRAAVAAGVNVTFKVLRNSAVAMTGGQQPVGELGLAQLLALLAAEGVAKVVVTTEDPDTLRRQVPRQTDVRHRDDLLDVQRELAAVSGVTVLVHDQECAAEKRRKRRRREVEAPARRVLINERVCEGCGDCGTASNCLSVQPIDTEFGRKTRINQSSCNLDFSCLAGDCPSFLTVVPGAATKRANTTVAAPPEPVRVADSGSFGMRIAGIGGTGVVTVSQVLATAAAIEGRHVRTLDQTGLAQKGGAVVSDLKLSDQAADRAPRLARGECDLYLGCDSLVAAEPANLAVTHPDRTVAVVSTAQVPTGRMVVDTGATFPAGDQIALAIEPATRTAHFLDAAGLARQHFGDEQYANMIMVGAAYQTGALPVGANAIEEAIGLNGVAVERNVAAFRYGRLAIHESADAVPAPAETLDELLERRVAELTEYQNAEYAERYAGFVDEVRRRELAVAGDTELTTAVARNLYKLMAYKDEYEVARLSLDPALAALVTEQFGAGARFSYQLHPPLLRALGMKRKLSLGPWFRICFRLLRALRFLRGTPLDPFGYAEVRRVERVLIDEYRTTITGLLPRLDRDNHAIAVRIAGLPDGVRGYEHIKLRNVARYREQTAELVTQLNHEVRPTTGSAR